MEPQRQLREGILSNATFPSLMYSILSHRETGVLTLTGDTAEKSVYIQAGRPVSSPASSDREDRLGQVLFRAGKVSLEGLVDSLEVVDQQPASGSARCWSRTARSSRTI